MLRADLRSVPPLIDDVANPDFALIQSTVDAALVPYTPPPTDPAE